MGSVCCVASRSPRQPLSSSSSSSSSYNTNGPNDSLNAHCSDPNSHHWRIHGGFSPPIASSPWALSSVSSSYHQNHTQVPHNRNYNDDNHHYNGAMSSGYFSSSFRKKARSQSQSRSNGNSASGSPLVSMRRDGHNNQSMGRDGNNDRSMGRNVYNDQSMGRDGPNDRSMGRDQSMSWDANHRDQSMSRDVNNGLDRSMGRDVNGKYLLRCLSSSMQSDFSLPASQSAPGSFRASSHWIRNEIGDHFVSSNTTPDSLSSTTFRAKEGHVTKAESSSSFRSRADLGHRPSSSFNANLSGGFSSLYRFGSKAFFHKPRSHNNNNHHNSNTCETTLEKGDTLAGQETKDWSMQAFSQLIASSQREGFGTSGINNVFYAESPEEERAEEEPSLPLSIEKIQVAFSQGLHEHSNSDSARGSHDVHTCGICSRLLTRRSPWSSQRMSNNADLPVTGVLVCGHVFHADCLEKVVPPYALKHDPPCPECEKPKKPPPVKSNMLLGFSSLKEPIKNKLSKIAPQEKRALTSVDIDKEKRATSSFRERGFFHRSTSKKQASPQMRSSKDLPSQSLLCSKKFGSPAQVSPENQS